MSLSRDKTNLFKLLLLIIELTYLLLDKNSSFLAAFIDYIIHTINLPFVSIFILFFLQESSAKSLTIASYCRGNN